MTDLTKMTVEEVDEWARSIGSYAIAFDELARRLTEANGWLKHYEKAEAQQYKDLREEIERMKNILRRGHNELEIRMSHNDNHLLRIITDQELRDLVYPTNRVTEVARFMYAQLHNYEAARKPE